MAEEFLTLMADLDEISQKRLSEWYDTLAKAGFVGTQTPGLPYHISLASFPLEREEKVVGLMKKAAAEFPAIPVHINHIGMFAGGKVLFAAPERNAQLDALHDACETDAACHRPDRRAGSGLLRAVPVFAVVLPVCRKYRPTASLRLLANKGDSSR